MLKEINFRSAEFEDVYHIKCDCGGAIEFPSDFCEGDIIECSGCETSFKVADFWWNIVIYASSQKGEMTNKDCDSFEASQSIECNCGEELEVDVGYWALGDIECNKCGATYSIDTSIDVDIKLIEELPSCTDTFYATSLIDQRAQKIKKLCRSRGLPPLKNLIGVLKKDPYFLNFCKEKQDNILNSAKAMDELAQDVFYGLADGIQFQTIRIPSCEFFLDKSPIC